MKTCFMIQGTTSSAGKSAFTAGFLRYFSSRGLSSSPFKSQNMSLNSVVTEDGYEIAVSQALQSEAAFKKPTKDMNPILLKPSSDNRIHIILQGKFYENTDFKSYNKRKTFFLEKSVESFNILRKNNELIVLEGAGSPAEINLFKFDIVNMGFAEIFDIPVILVADIERGGVFASIFGTVKLMPPKWRRLIKGFIINKFRGDASILNPGIDSIESMLKIPCLGVMPYIKNLRLEPEDSLIDYSSHMDGCADGDNHKNYEDDVFKIGILKLEKMSNFNEFDSLLFDERFKLSFFENADADSYENIHSFDMIIIPGSKSTASDIIALKKTGVFDCIADYEKKERGLLMGICGGFQMMGISVKDPFKMESDIEYTAGFGFFDAETTIEKEKKLINRKYLFDFDGRNDILSGYEIHNGRTFYNGVMNENKDLTVYGAKLKK